MYRFPTAADGSRWCELCGGRFSPPHFQSVAHMINGGLVKAGQRPRAPEPPPHRLNGAGGAARVLVPERVRAGSGDGRQVAA